MSHSIQCVHCKAVLKSKTLVPANKTVTCPKCKQTFITPAADHITKFEKTTSLDALPPTPPAPAASSVFADDEMDAALAKLDAEQAAGKKPAAAPPPPKQAAIPNMEIPDTDDELVEPDAAEVEPEAMVEPVDEIEEEPRSRRSRHDEEDEEPRSRRKRPEDDEEEDEPRSRRKRRDDDEKEDDEPRSRRKRRDDDEEEDDESRSRRKRRDDDEDDDDEPQSRRKRRDDDDDEDDRPRSKKQKKSGSGALLWILLAGGAVLGLIACCGVGIGGYFLLGFARPNIVGRWENREFLPIVYEFNADQTGKLEALGTETFFDYSLRGSELTITPTRMRAKGLVDMPVPAKEGRPINVQRIGDTLRIESFEGRRRVMVFRKIN